MNDRTLNKIKNIVLSDEKRKIIVVSAPGKRFESDKKVTDLLLKAAFNSGYNEKNDIFNEVESRYLSILLGCVTEFDINRVKKLIREQLEKSDGETLVSRGEYLSARILALYLEFEFIDAVKLIKIKNGMIDEEKCAEAAKKINVDKGIVVPGFYGEDENGKIVLLPRGGSDLTGAVLSVAFGAKIYENFTDTDGVRSADPKKVSDTEAVEKISYGLLSDYAFYGAKVLSAETCEYLKYSSVKTIVKRSESGGETAVTANAECNKKLFTATPAVKVIVKKHDGEENEIFFFEVITAAKNSDVKILYSRLKNDKSILFLSHYRPDRIFCFFETLKNKGYYSYPCEHVLFCVTFCPKNEATRFLTQVGSMISDFSFDDGALAFCVKREYEKIIYEKFGKFEHSERQKRKDIPKA